MSRAGWHYGSVDAVRNEAGVGDQSDECRNGTRGCPGPDADVDELPCLECLADASDGDREVATDGGECVDGTERECPMDHEWCNGPDGETVSGEAFGGLCGECYIERSRETETDRSEGEGA